MPLTLFGLRARARGGGDRAGDEPPRGDDAGSPPMAEPDAALITVVQPEHLEGLGSIEGVADAEGELFAGLSPRATAVVNLDDPHVVAAGGASPGRAARRSGAPPAPRSGSLESTRRGASGLAAGDRRPTGGAGRSRSASSASTTRSTPPAPSRWRSRSATGPRSASGGWRRRGPRAAAERRRRARRRDGGGRLLQRQPRLDGRGAGHGCAALAGRGPGGGGARATCSSWARRGARSTRSWARGRREVATLAAFFGPRSGWAAARGRGSRVARTSPEVDPLLAWLGRSCGRATWSW